jgi:hypothetical protein
MLSIGEFLSSDMHVKSIQTQYQSYINALKKSKEDMTTAVELNSALQSFDKFKSLTKESLESSTKIQSLFKKEFGIDLQLAKNFDDAVLLKLRMARPKENVAGIYLRNVDEEYTIEKMLGMGSYGRAYLAKSKDNKDVVVKFVDPQEKESFLREMNGLRKTDTLVSFNYQKRMLVQTYYEGTPLNAYLIEFFKKNRLGLTQTQEQYLQSLKQSYEGLAVWINERGLRHNDIAPRNVIMGKDGELHLIDYGLSVDAPKHQIDESKLDFNDEDNVFAVKSILADAHRAELEWEMLVLQLKIRTTQHAETKILLEKEFAYISEQLRN